jgi:putative membrane protein
VNRIGLLLALAGLGLAVWLIAQQDLGQIAGLLGQAGFGLLLVAAAHVLFMAANGWGWAIAMPGRQRPHMGRILELTWIRESVNTLLPVGRVGGELACYRLLRARGMGPGPAAGGLLIDMGLSVVAQLGFALLGLALLMATGRTLGWVATLGVVLGGALLAAPFIAVQNARTFGRLSAWLARVSQGRLAGFGESSRRIDGYLRRAWRKPRLLLWSFSWQMFGNILGALQIWIALWLLGHPVSFLDALIIEALVQAVAAFAFAVPGGLGLVEAGYLGVGALMGLDAEVSLALALVRRLRELLLYLPGLAAWALAERRLAA